MLRIMFSRAALLPWLGIAMMTVGAFFPDGHSNGIILIVIGANVAFYSLHDFSQHFAWGADSRASLMLCGVTFLSGLALVAVSTLVESFSGGFAVVCIGLYLCLFAV